MTREGKHHQTETMKVHQLTTLGSFEEVIHDLFSVYETADAQTHILTRESVPKGFHESNPSKILSSLENFTKQHSSINYTDVTSKYKQGEYSASPYKLYHDIKVAASSAIATHKLGSKAYNDIDFFYKFTTELLMREVSRLGVALFKKEKDVVTELDALLAEEFKMISESYLQSNGEVISFIHNTEEADPRRPHSFYSNVPHSFSPYNNMPRTNTAQPLFLSLVGKSELDSKPTIVEGDFSVSKVIPVDPNSLARSTNTLESLSPEVPKFSGPVDPQSSAILHDFFHPIWYTIPIPTWLTYRTVITKPEEIEEEISSDPSKPKLAVLQHFEGLEKEGVVSNADFYRSFAPSSDLSDYVISRTQKNSIWFHHIGLEEIESIKKNYLNRQAGIQEETVADAGKPQTTNGEAEEDEDMNVDVDNDDEDEDEELVDISQGASNTDVDLKNLIEWDPIKISTYKSIKKDSQNIDSAEKLQRQISQTLIKLNKLRHERLLNVRNQIAGTEPSIEEVRLYTKALTLIKIAMYRYKIQPLQFAFSVDDKLPVLVPEYTGSLPGLPGKVMNSVANGQTAYPQVRPSTRLPSIRGPYKKKNRF